MHTWHFLIAVGDLGKYQIPEEWAQRLTMGGIILTGLFVIWLVFKILGYMHRKAYNLTKAETARAGKAPDPAFLKVDKEKRAEAIKRGDEYVRPADRETTDDVVPPKPKWSFWSTCTRIFVVFAALAHFGIAMFTVAADVEGADSVFSSSDRVAAVFEKYWYAFALAAIVVVTEIIRAFRPHKS